MILSHRSKLILYLCTLPFVIFASRVTAKDKHGSTPVVRWAEGQPGCTFSLDNDGMYRYGMWSDDLGLTLAVDTQEIQKARRRVAEPVFAVLLKFRYRGEASVLSGDSGTLEFVKHKHVIHRSFNSDVLSTKLQAAADAVSDQIDRELRKHPERKQEKQALLAAFEKDVAAMQEFVRGHSLRAVQLDPGTREAEGWLFFATRDKWIAGLKDQEEFVLQVPFGKKIFAFPFKLPMNERDLVLRRRN
jgi:hypothetical protein